MIYYHQIYTSVADRQAETESSVAEVFPQSLQLQAQVILVSLG
jgi:hypothetical protein